jgi:hypothetical protein
MTGILNALFASLAGGPTETTVEYLVIAGGGGGWLLTNLVVVAVLVVTALTLLLLLRTPSPKWHLAVAVLLNLPLPQHLELLIRSR